MCRFVPARASDTAEDTAVHLINNVIRHHGCPDRIIADNDTRLRAGFWEALTARLGIEMKNTSSYHPRANGKVENSHATLYDILRSMVDRWGDNWAEHLPLAEFAFNSSVCSSTGFSPFEVAYGSRPPFPGDMRGEPSDVPRAEAAATRIIALTTACRDKFEISQMENQDRVSRRNDGVVSVGDLVLLSTTNLVDLKNRTACPRLSSRYVGPFRVVKPPPEEPPESYGRSKNFVWLALPITLGEIQQPINLARLRRFVERPAHLGTIDLPPILSLAADWGRHCGKHIQKVRPADLAEFCVGHQLELTLPEDYFPPDHHTFPFRGPRAVRVYDTLQEGTAPLQIAVYLLDLPLPVTADGHQFATAHFPIVSPRRTPEARDWSFLRALKYSFPGLTYLKDLLPNADSTVVFRQTTLPIHKVVAARVTKGGKRELLVQFAKDHHENSAWVLEKFVPPLYREEFWERVEPDGPPAPAHDV